MALIMMITTAFAGSGLTTKGMHCSGLTSCYNIDTCPYHLLNSAGPIHLSTPLWPAGQGRRCTCHSLPRERACPALGIPVPQFICRNTIPHGGALGHSSCPGAAPLLQASLKG